MTLINSMRNEAISMTDMGTKFAIVWQEIEDVIIEVFADAASIEYTAKSGDDIFITEDINEFNEVLVYAFN